MNRNNILKSSILMFILGLVTSCGDLVDLEPPTEIRMMLFKL